MTIVATSIPILRVFFKQAVSQAMSNYHNSTSRSKSKSTASGSNPSQPSNNASTLANDTRRLSKKITHITGHTSTDSLFRDDDIENQDRKEGYIELDDLVVDEKTGRVTALTPDSLPDSITRAPIHAEDWPLGEYSLPQKTAGSSRDCGR
ncbi:hypothetical protein IG631_08632 [Alternaria alternata]|jgi:hypothetical protein|nr:hypothetical protein IG631_08632 [Alternaria alternata]